MYQQPRQLEGRGLVLAGMGPGNTVPGYQSHGGASLGRQIQLDDSARQHLRLRMAFRQHQSLIATRGCRQPIALLKGFQKTYTCLGLARLSEEPSPFLDVLLRPRLKSPSSGCTVPEMLLSPYLLLQEGYGLDR